MIVLSYTDGLIIITVGTVILMAGVAVSIVGNMKDMPARNKQLHENEIDELKNYTESLEDVILQVLPIISRHIETANCQTEKSINTISTGLSCLCTRGGLATMTHNRDDSDERIGNILVEIQFQDRVSQILSNVIDDIHKIVEDVESTRRQRSQYNRSISIDIDSRLSDMKSSYTTREERLNHVKKTAPDDEDKYNSDITFF